MLRQQHHRSLRVHSLSTRHARPGLRVDSVWVIGPCLERHTSPPGYPPHALIRRPFPSPSTTRRRDMFDFTKHYATRLARLVTPQAEPIPGTAQVPNSAGGYAWPVDEWMRFDRFLIFGSERGTYYIRERTLTAENAMNVRVALEEDGPRAVRRIVEISVAGRAPTNVSVLFAVAMCVGLGNGALRVKALDALPHVARTTKNRI